MKTEKEKLIILLNIATNNGWNNCTAQCFIIPEKIETIDINNGYIDNMSIYQLLYQANYGPYFLEVLCEYSNKTFDTELDWKLLRIEFIEDKYGEPLNTFLVFDKLFETFKNILN